MQFLSLQTGKILSWKLTSSVVWAFFLVKDQSYFKKDFDQSLQTISYM